MDEFAEAYKQSWLDADDAVDAEANECDGFWFQSETSSGYYLPNGLILSLAGDSEVEHHVTHLHEVYHKSLNDSTAWGSALHFAYEYQPWMGELFADLRHAAFTTHEVFATFKSINLAEMHYPDASAILIPGSACQRHYRRAQGFVGALDGAIRQDLMLTAAARVSMQTPILSVAESTFPESFELSAITMADRPDGRFAWLLVHATSLVADIASRADNAVVERFGQHTAGIHPLERSIEDPELDEICDAWERTVYDEFARILTEKGSTVLSMDGHSESAGRLVELLTTAGVTGLVVPAADAPPASDYDESVALLSRTRFPLRDDLWPANFGYMKGSVEPDDFMHVLEQVAAVDGVPEFVVHARLAGRLCDGYRWNEPTATRLADMGNDIVVSVKCRTHQDDSDAMEIFHVAFRDAADVLETLQAWNDRGPTGFCIAASCFTDPQFAARWIEPLRRHLPLVLLLDVPTRALTGADKALLPTNQPTYGVYWGLTGTPYKALVWHVETQSHVGIFIGDSLATQLMYGQFEDIMGTNFSMEDADWSEWESTITAVIRSVTQSESFVDLRALESIRPPLRR